MIIFVAHDLLTKLTLIYSMTRVSRRIDLSIGTSYNDVKLRSAQHDDGWLY